MITKEKQPLVSVVIPFLNEESNLPDLYDRLVRVFDACDVPCEMVFVDDGSKDSSAAWVAGKANGDPRIVLLRLSRNFGHQIAITAGMDEARGDAVIIIDSDLQDPPEVIPDLIEKWKEGNDVVYAVRRHRDGESFFKRGFATLFYRVFHRMANVEIPVDAGDFRLVDRRVIEALSEVREMHRFVRGLTCWVGFRQAAVYYERAARHSGHTKYPVFKSLRLAVDALTSFSGAPLRWIMALGMLVSLAGALWVISIVLTYMFHPERLVKGWASIMGLLLLLSGFQLVSMGVMGQYVSRIFEESKKRPLYFVQERIGSKHVMGK